MPDLANRNRNEKGEQKGRKRMSKVTRRSVVLRNYNRRKIKLSHAIENNYNRLLLQ